MTEVLVIAENSDQTTHCAPHNLRAHVTLEVYSFSKEWHMLWEVPCIQPSETEGFIIVAAKVSLNCSAPICVDTC
jgi:hypothetical protein